VLDMEKIITVPMLHTYRIHSGLMYLVLSLRKGRSYSHIRPSVLPTIFLHPRCHKDVFCSMVTSDSTRYTMDLLRHFGGRPFVPSFSTPGAVQRSDWPLIVRLIVVFSFSLVSY
jgi:hypothetical protein